MKFPNVYVTSQFLDEMDKFALRYKESNFFELNDEDSYHRESLDRIKNLFLSSNFQTDISSSEIEKYKRSERAVFNSFKDILLNKIIRNSYAKDKPQLVIDKISNDFDQINCSFFLSQSRNNCSDYSARHGKIVIGKSFLDNPFYLNHSFSVESTSNDIPQAGRLSHPCSSLLIIDSYLLQKNGKQFQKIDNLIRFLKVFLPKKLKKPFEIDIVTFNPDTEYIEKLNSDISEKIGVSFSLHIYFPPRDIYKESDRYFITDYSITVIGHPLDRSSYISSNFIPSNHSTKGIQSGMELWFKKINGVKEMIDYLNIKYPEGNYSWRTPFIKLKDEEDLTKSDSEQHRIFKI